MRSGMVPCHDQALEHPQRMCSACLSRQTQGSQMEHTIYPSNKIYDKVEKP